MDQERDKYINPLTDFGFKKLFGTEPNKDLLIDLLSEILPNRKIKDLTFASNEHFGKSELDRKAIFDIYCIGEDGERFIVEMQKAKQNYFKDRSVFYASFPIQEQAEKGDWNFRLKPVYSVGILDFEFDKNDKNKELLHVVELKNQRCEVFYKKLKFVYLELPKFTKTEKELETNFDKWMYVFTHLWKLQERPKKLEKKVFKKLFKVAEIAQFSEQERKAYEESLKHYRDIKNVVDTAKEEGRQEGRNEEKIAVAKKLKQNGIAVSVIAASTGLSEEEIRKL